MILGNISLGPCILNRILLAELVVEIWELILVILCGLVKTFITGPGAILGQSNFSSHASSAAKLIARFTGDILGEFITAVPINSECTPSS